VTDTLATSSAGQNHVYIGFRVRGCGDDLVTENPWNRHIPQNYIDFVPILTQQFDRGRTFSSFEYLEAGLTEHLHNSLAQRSSSSTTRTARR